MGKEQKTFLYDDPVRELSIEDIERLLGHKVKLVEKKYVEIVKVPNGGVFKIGGIEFIVLDGGVNTLAIAKNLYGSDEIFDKTSNNYEHSNLHLGKVMDAFEHEIKTWIPSECLVMRNVDLTADNGMDDYGTSRDYAAPMTIDEFRKYANVLQSHPTDRPWWLVTAHGTENKNGSKDVCYVDTNNMIEHVKCDATMGVRPVICLKYSATVEYDGKVH